MLPEVDTAFSGRFVTNIFSNVFMLGISIAIGIWLTPYLIDHLGLALFGLIPLATSITGYLSIINKALSGAIGRFLTIDLRQGHVDRANVHFNTALWSSLAVVGVLLPVMVGVSTAVPRLFNIPVGHEQATTVLFAAVFAAYLIGILSGIFRVSTFIRNRFDLENITSATEALTRVAIIVILFNVAVPEVWHVGAATLLAGSFALMLTIVIWRKLTPLLRVNYRAFDRQSLGEMFGMSSWIMINQIGALLLLNVDLIIINRFLGAEVAGGYGSALQWPRMLRLLAWAVSSVLTPLVVSQYARGETRSMIRVSRQAVKLMGISIALPVGIVTGASASLLRVWLGESFTYLTPLLMIMAVHLCINLAVLPIFSVMIAQNKVRWPGIFSLSMGVLNLILALWWVRWGQNGLGVALAGALVLTLKNAIFTPIYGAQIQKLPWFAYLNRMVPSVLATLAIAGLSYSLAQWWQPQDWISLGGIGILISSVYALFVLVVILDEGDRRLLRKLLPMTR